MALGITATPNNDQAFVSITVTGLAFSNTITVSRNNPDGSVVPVRGASNQATGGASTMAFFDFEAPLDRTVTYTATVDQAALNANTDFEVDASHWSAETATSVARSTTFAHSGSASLVLTPDGTDVQAVAIADEVPVIGGNDYIARGWFLTSPGAWATGGAVRVNWNDASHNYITTAGPADVPMDAGETWYQTVQTLTAPANAAYAEVHFISEGTPPAGQLFWIDDIALVDPSGATATSGPVTITTDGRTFWLKNVAQETLSVKVTVSSMTNPVRKARVLAQYDVLGRANPIVISDVRSGRSGSMTLVTNDPSDSDALVAIFEAGDALLLQTPASVNFPDMYFTAGDLTEHILGLPQDPNRAFEVPYVEVDAPTDNLVSLSANSWLLVTDFGSWTNVMAKRTSWLDVLNRGWTDGDA